MKRVLTIVLGTLLVLALSVPVFAQVHGTIDFGTDINSGSWGFTYYRELGAEAGVIQPYMHIRNDSQRWNKSVRGAYVDGGQRLVTLIGARLGVDYSPYTATFSPENRYLGYRIADYKLKTPIGQFTLDGTYIFGYYTTTDLFKPEAYVGKRDILLGMSGTIDPLSTKVKAAAKYKNNGNDEWFWDYSVILDTTIIPDVPVQIIRAGYLEKNDWLHEITANWKIQPGILEVKAGYRNSEIDSVTYIVGASDDQNYRYISNAGRDAINAIYNRDQSYNVGATLWFDVGTISNKLDVGYDTTNPATRGDLDDQVSVALDSDFAGFSVKQQVAVLLPDANSIVRGDIGDDTQARVDYRLAVTTPDYSLPFGISATGMFNYDWDTNYSLGSRNHSIIGAKFSTTKDILNVKGIMFDAFAFLDVPGEPIELREWNWYKYVLRARYTAPNQIKFHAEYVSSVDFEKDATWVHNEPLYKRYAPYMFHAPGDTGSADFFSGFRFALGIPF